MAETNIEWTDFSFNSHWGCTKVSPACDHCYAETWAKRTGFPNLWGVDAERRTFSANHWMEPFRWQRVALQNGSVGPRPRVFCNSMSDVFDNHAAVAQERFRLWQTIKETPALDWLVLTKRIGNAKTMLPADWGDGYPNVWLGISVVNQVEADRDIPKLLETPARLRFLSCEPLLGRVDLFAFERGICTTCAGAGEVAAGGPTTTFPEDDDGIERCQECRGTGKWEDNPGLDWVIAGGESGGGARSMDMLWADILRRECLHQKIPFFMKQLSQADSRDYKDFDEFPSHLRVREWPKTL
jgi:protein gp37